MEAEVSNMGINEEIGENGSIDVDEMDDVPSSVGHKDNGFIEAGIMEEPEVGMVFDTIDGLLEYYIKYGNGKGFSVKKRSSEKGDDGEVRWVTFACSRSGQTKSTSRNVFKMHPEIKTDCKAKVRAALCGGGKWRVTSIVLDHNHELSPGESRYYKKNRIMRSYVKRKRPELNDWTAIKPNKTCSSIVVGAGEHDNEHRENGSLSGSNEKNSNSENNGNICVLENKENDHVSGENNKEPEMGMVFDTIDEILDYYIKYGNEKGFSVKKRSSEKGEDGEVRWVTFACSRSGKTESTSKNAFKMYPLTKTDCKSKVRAALCPDGKWRITSVLLDHNHELSPGQPRYYKKNRIMRSYVKRRPVLSDKGIIKTNKKRSYMVEAVGHEKERFDRMCNAFYQVADLATDNEDKTNVVMRRIELLVNELKNGDEACVSSELNPLAVDQHPCCK